MANTGPPWYASDSAEAARAMVEFQHRPRRAAFVAQQQAALRGNPARALSVRQSFMPLKRHGGDLNQ